MTLRAEKELPLPYALPPVLRSRLCWIGHSCGSLNSREVTEVCPGGTCQKTALYHPRESYPDTTEVSQWKHLNTKLPKVGMLGEATGLSVLLAAVDCGNGCWTSCLSCRRLLSDPPEPGNGGLLEKPSNRD